MLQSMTGYGKAACELDSKRISIEIKSLNSKQLEINTRLPSLYKEKDIELRNKTADKLIRGKIDILITYELLDAEETAQINEEVVRNYFEKLHSIKSKLQISSNDNMLEIIMRLPDTLRPIRQELDEKEWNVLKDSIGEALDKVIEFRKQEGVALQNDIQNRINTILEKLNCIKNFESKRIEDIKERISKNLDETIGMDKVNADRFEQEVLYYLEKLDITEEKVRLKNHCEYFLLTLKENESKGKKLGFICQEIGREINTIGSKANDSDIQKLVVEMKDELEKIKEQIMNVL